MFFVSSFLFFQVEFLNIGIPLLRYKPSFRPPFFKGGGVNFKYLPRRGESEKIEKGGGSMVQGQVFLKGRAGIFPI